MARQPWWTTISDNPTPNNSPLWMARQPWWTTISDNPTPNNSPLWMARQPWWTTISDNPKSQQLTAVWPGSPGGQQSVTTPNPNNSPQYGLAALVDNNQWQPQIPATHRWGWPGSPGGQQSVTTQQLTAVDGQAALVDNNQWQPQIPTTHRCGWPGSPGGWPREKRNRRCPAPYRDRSDCRRKTGGCPGRRCWSLWPCSCSSWTSSRWTYIRSRCSWNLKWAPPLRENILNETTSRKRKSERLRQLSYSNNNNVHSSCAHQRPERLHHTY